jgi:hypothetical protein
MYPQAIKMATKYVLPHLRKAAPAPALETADLTSQELFPQLGEAKQSTWTGKSFKQTIHDLIAYEKMTEQERAQQMMREKAMSGWHILPKFTHEWLLRFNEKMIALNSAPLKDTNFYRANIITKIYADDDNCSVMTPVEDFMNENESEVESESEEDKPKEDKSKEDKSKTLRRRA